MKDERKTKKQLIEELEELRGQQDPFASHLRQAVEQVRAEAVSMRHSEDLLTLVGVMFEEVQRLGLDVACPTVVFLNAEADDCVYYNSFPNPARLGISWTSSNVVACSEEIVAEVGGRHSYREWLQSEDGQSWQQGTAWVDRFYISEDFARQTAEVLGFSRPVLEWTTREVTRASVPFERGLLKLAVWEDHPHLMRVAEALAEALSLGYVRFLDLVHLEEQNHQLEIEQILERVRGQALGMLRSEDLTGVGSTVFRELRSLDLAVWRSGFGIYNDQGDPPEIELWYTTTEGDAVRTGGTYRIDEDADSVIWGIYLAWKRGEEHHSFDIGGDELKAMVRHLTEERDLSLPEWRERRQADLPERLWSNYIFFPQGYLYVPTLGPIPVEELRVLKQLVAVFGVAYNRFLELQQAEEYARQAERRAAVDRVRAEIATMRTSADLEHLTPLIWKELTDAGVAFFRCGVFIAAEEGTRVRTYLTNPQGESLGVLDLGADSHLFIGRVLASWRAAQVHFEQWDQPTFPEVFALGHSRHLDLQAAEERAAQSAREAAYERVRSAVLASRNTKDILVVNSLMDQELRELGVRLTACGINLIDEDTDTSRYFYSWDESAWDEPLSLEDPVIAELVSHWRAGETWIRPPPPTWARGDRFRDVRVIVDVPFAHGTLAMNSTEVDEFSEDEIAILQGFAEVISLAYTRYLDLSAIEDAQRQKMASLEEELQTARDMQIGLRPTAPPEIAGLSAAGRCVTVNHVGGDFFQYFGQDDGIAISLADVTGHAMEAAIPAVMFSGVLDKQMEIPTTLEGRFSGLNRSMCRSLGEHTYVCLSMLVLDPAGRTMRVANCGCPYPLLYRQETSQIEEIQIEAYPLGIRPDTEYAAKEVPLSPGDYVVLHSDGFSEAANSEEQLFGFDRTMEVIRQGCSEGLSPEELIDRLIGEVKAFTGDEPQADDMTCVVIEVEA